MHLSRVFGVVALATVSIACVVAQRPLPVAESAEKLSPDQIAGIIEKFERLPISEGYWIERRWPQVSDPRWLPALQKVAMRNIDFRKPGRLEFDRDYAISKVALKRWYELDPASGREAILREISSPTPRYDAGTLGILPDQTLPLEEHIIAQHFASLAPPAPIPPNPTDHRPGTTRQAAYLAYETAQSNLASLRRPRRTPGGDARLNERRCPWEL